MALIHPYSKKVLGKILDFPSAYFQINYLSGTKFCQEITLTAYDDAEKQNVICQNIYTFRPSVSEGSLNFIKQGYEFLKTLQEFAEAVDV